MSEERRHNPRFSVPGDTQAHLILQHQHRGPVMLSAHLTDISETGRRAVITGLLHRVYQDLIRKSSARPVRLECSFPDHNHRSRLSGQIAFFDYHGNEAEPSCTFGIRFQNLQPAEREAVDEFVESIRLEESGARPGFTHQY